MQGVMYGATADEQALSVVTPVYPLIAVVFSIGSQRYALPIAYVLEVVRLPLLLMLANAPPVLAGLLNLRSQHIPVLDGRAVLGEVPHYDVNAQIIIVGQISSQGNPQPQFGLLVDQVHDIHTFHAAHFTPIDQRMASTLFWGVLNDGSESVLLFALETLQQFNTLPQS